MANPFSLEGKNAWITGASYGIGFNIAKAFVAAGVDNIILSTTGYTGAGGCVIYIPAAKAIDVWNAVFEAGKEYGIMPAGLGCRDTLRLEKGFCLYGHEMDDTISPLEAPLAWITKLKAENNKFINKLHAKIYTVEEAMEVTKNGDRFHVSLTYK